MGDHVRESGHRRTRPGAVAGGERIQLRAPPTPDALRKTLETVFTSGEPGGYEIADPPEDGAATLHVIRFGPVVKDDQVVAATLLSLDVTDTVG